MEVHSCIQQDVPEFKEQEVRKVAIENLRKRGIEGLVAASGGDGSYHSAQRISEENV